MMDSKTARARTDEARKVNSILARIELEIFNASRQGLDRIEVIIRWGITDDDFDAVCDQLAKEGYGVRHTGYPKAILVSW